MSQRVPERFDLQNLEPGIESNVVLGSGRGYVTTPILITATHFFLSLGHRCNYQKLDFDSIPCMVSPQLLRCLDPDRERLKNSPTVLPVLSTAAVHSKNVIQMPQCTPPVRQKCFVDYLLILSSTTSAKIIFIYKEGPHSAFFSSNFSFSFLSFLPDSAFTLEYANTPDKAMPVPAN